MLSDNNNEPMLDIPIRIVRDPRITGRDFKVLAVMFSHWNQESGFDVTNSVLARESGYSERAVDLALGVLERSGYIDPVVPPGSVRIVDDEGDSIIVTPTEKGYRALGLEPPR